MNSSIKAIQLDSRHEALDKRELRLSKQIQSLKKARVDANALTTIKCVHCRKRFFVRDAIFLQQMWYESPYGCTGGDNWWCADECSIVCPLCDKWSRFYEKDAYTLLLKMKYSFKQNGKIHDCKVTLCDTS
jgi:hypothetical protein